MIRLSRKARRLVRLYGEAREADSWKGGGDPEDIPETEAYLRVRTEKLHAYIAELESLQHGLATRDAAIKQLERRINEQTTAKETT